MPKAPNILYVLRIISKFDLGMESKTATRPPPPDAFTVHPLVHEAVYSCGIQKRLMLTLIETPLNRVEGKTEVTRNARNPKSGNKTVENNIINNIDYMRI